MAEILTDFPTVCKQIASIFCHFRPFCLLPVGKSVNISAIPRCTVKTKCSLDLPFVKYFYIISFCGEMPSVLLNQSKCLFLIDHHCKTQSEMIGNIEISQN